MSINCLIAYLVTGFSFPSWYVLLLLLLAANLPYSISLDLDMVPGPTSSAGNSDLPVSRYAEYLKSKYACKTLLEDEKRHYTLRNKVAIAHLIRCAGRVPYSTPLFGVLSTLLLVV